MNIAINIICVYLAREKVIKINLFCGDKANRRADPAAEYRRKQGASGPEDLRLENVMPDGMPQGAENLIVMHDSHPQGPAL